MQCTAHVPKMLFRLPDFIVFSHASDLCKYGSQISRESKKVVDIMAPFNVGNDDSVLHVAFYDWTSIITRKPMETYYCRKKSRRRVSAASYTRVDSREELILSGLCWSISICRFLANVRSITLCFQFRQIRRRSRARALWHVGITAARGSITLNLLGKLELYTLEEILGDARDAVFSVVYIYIYGTYVPLRTSSLSDSVEYYAPNHCSIPMISTW
jgi:hypothetical protein